MARIQLRKLRKAQLIALVIWCIAFLASRYWWAHRVKERRELKALYYAGMAGDLGSVKRLESYNSEDALHLLEELAQSPSAFADSRVEAIIALGTKESTFDSKVIATLLWIEQPSAVRHAAADVFLRRGCDSACVSAAMYSLHAIRQGQLTSEMRLATEHPETALMAQRSVAEMRRQSEGDYLELLRSKPCLARKELLSSEYRSDSAFVAGIAVELPDCRSAPR